MNGGRDIIKMINKVDRRNDKLRWQNMQTCDFSAVTDDSVSSSLAAIK